MKTPEEIKKAIVYCLTGDCPREECPYYYGEGCACGYDRNKDALRYIEQLEIKLNQAVEDMRMLGRIGANICPVCAHHNHGEGSKEHCITCIINRETDNFEWRGMKGEKTHDE